MKITQHARDFLGLEDDGLHAPGLCSFGGGSSGSTQTVQKADPWSGQQPYLTDIYDQAKKLDQNNVPQYYPDNTYAGLTPQQTGVMSKLIDYGSNGGSSGLQAANSNLTNTLSSDYTAPTSGAFGKTQGYLSNTLDPSYLNPWNSPSFGTVVNNTLASVIPQTSASFINGGRSDSGLAERAQTMAATDAVGNLAQTQYNKNQDTQNQAAALASNNFLTQQGNQTKAAALAPIVDQTISGNLGTALNTAGMSQQDAQNQIQANMSRWNYNQELPWNQLGMYENAVTGTGSPGGTTTTSQPYFSNTLANTTSALGTLGSLGMLGYLAFSDRDLKTDIEQIGTSNSGFPLYTFRYKGEPPMSRHIGLMAQDVEKSRPGAVIETPIGKAVNYSMAFAA